MVPKAQTGKSFIGLYSYLSADQRTEQERERGISKTSNERVLFSETLNMAGLEATRGAAHLMKETAKQNTHCKNPVYAFSLSWHPEEHHSHEHMKTAATDALKVLGMEEHQAMFFAHSDTPHPHIHIMVNRIHPETLKAKNNFQDFKRLSEWARGYEREQGKVYCPEREARAAEREQNQGKNQHRYAENTIIQAWSHADSGKAFKAALEADGWKFGLGDRKDKFLAVTPSGKPLDILRELNKTLDKGQKLRAADIESRFADLNRDTLKRVADLQAELEKERETAKSRDAAKQQSQKEESKTKTQAVTPKKRPRYDREYEKKEQLRKIQDSKRRALKRAGNARIREQNATHQGKDFQQTHDEIQKIRQQHNSLTAQHREQQRIMHLDISRKREQCTRDLENYKLDEKKQQIRDAQDRLSAKPSIFGKITGQHKREHEKAREELHNLNRSLEDAKKRAAEWQQINENQIREKTNALNERQKQERQALPPLPEMEKTRGQEQQNSHERSRDHSHYER